MTRPNCKKCGILWARRTTEQPHQLRNIIYICNYMWVCVQARGANCNQTFSVWLAGKGQLYCKRGWNAEGLPRHSQSSFDYIGRTKPAGVVVPVLGVLLGVLAPVLPWPWLVNLTWDWGFPWKRRREAVFQEGCLIASICQLNCQISSAVISAVYSPMLRSGQTCRTKMNHPAGSTMFQLS